MQSNITIPEEALRDFCIKHGIRTLKLFGSALRDDFTPESDIDLLVEFEAGIPMGYFGFCEIEAQLTDLLGRKVDLNMHGSLSNYLRDQVLDDAQTVYVAA